MKFLIVFSALIAVCLAQNPPVAILKQSSDSSPDGSFNYVYQAENGIYADAQGYPKQIDKDTQAVVIQGQYQYVSPEGTPVQIQYVADENGFQPKGDVLPSVSPLAGRSP